MKTYILTGKAHLFTLVILLLNLFFLNNKTFAQETNSEIFNIVDEMPRFPGCEDKVSINDKEFCAQNKFLEYVYSNLKYPSTAIKDQIEGKVITRFIVDKNGEIKNVEILKDIGGGCGDEVKRVLQTIKTMPKKWVPGKLGGKIVDVYFTLPIFFTLNIDRPTFSNQDVMSNSGVDKKREF